jgi:hypothetical protein
MHQYELREFGKEKDLMLTRREFYEKPIQGLPPSHSSTIMMKFDEIDELIGALKDYADKGRNQAV